MLLSCSIIPGSFLLFLVFYSVYYTCVFLLIHFPLMSVVFCFINCVCVYMYAHVIWTTEEDILSFHLLLVPGIKLRSPGLHSISVLSHLTDIMPVFFFTVTSLKERNVVCIKKIYNHICTKHCAVHHGKGKLTGSTCISINDAETQIKDSERVNLEKLKKLYILHLVIMYSVPFNLGYPLESSG